MENDNDQKPKNEKQTIKLEAVKAVRRLSNGDSPWTIPQEILQEIQAGHIVVNPDKRVPITQMLEELKTEIEARYSEDEELKNLLLESLPEARQVRMWVKKDGWDDAVWTKVRGDKLFSADKRAQVIESLRLRAIDKSDVAAKIWLTLSGDYSEKMEVNDKTVDTFREINSILHKKKNESE